MDIVAAEPFATGSIAWQEQADQWTLTVVCKATYSLAPGTSPLAASREDVAERDNHWDDDPQRSVYAPSDLAPQKPRAEVVLVGSAFAPGGTPVRSLTARMIVGEVDKSIEVFGSRALGADGSLQEGARWTKMPLRWERAAGGLDSVNPVGHAVEVTDTYGRRALPNLQPPGIAVTGAGVPIAPVGFGPIAPAWRGRRDLLRHRAAAWSNERWSEEPLDQGFDFGFFNAAPADQRLKELRADEPLVLENLHPAHARLVTRLSGIRPRARVEAEEMPPWELSLVPDTLWIDTDRGICTLTWRGQIPLDHQDPRGLVRIGIEEPGQPVRWPSSQPAASPKSREGSRDGETTLEQEHELLHTAVDDAAIRRLLAERDKPVLPFQSAPPRLQGDLRAAMPQKAPAAAPAEPRLPRLWPAGEEQLQTTDVRVAAHPAQMPAWLAPEAPAPRPVAPPPMAPPPIAPPPVVPEMVRQSTPSHHDAPAPPVQSIGERAALSALEASNAAADRDHGGRAESAVTTSGHGLSRVLVELLWHEPAKLDRLRTHAGYKPFFDEHALNPPPAADDPQAAEKQARADRAAVGAALARTMPITEVESAIAEAGSADGALDAPMVVMAGDLELPFDEIKTLEVLLGAAASLAPGDKKLKEVTDLAGEVMKTPLGASPDVAGGFVQRVREAWARATRMLPADYLDVHARRILLDQRAYQKRTFGGAEWIRALLSPPGDSAAIPAYLPAALARVLPLFTKFGARVIAEAAPQQDQYENNPFALKVIALGRVVPARSRGR